MDLHTTVRSMHQLDVKCTIVGWLLLNEVVGLPSLHRRQHEQCGTCRIRSEQNAITGAIGCGETGFIGMSFF